MQQTTNYNLLIPEGTDVVNPLTQVNPNFQTIDGAMFANKQATIGTASEVVTGTVHAVIRNNPDSDVFRFTATGAWTAGDTMTLDGQQVTVHLSDGTTPATNSYIIGAEVLAMVNGTLVTLAISTTPPSQGVTSFNSRTGAVVPIASDYDASMVDYDNTTSGLNATDVQGAIDEVVTMIPAGGGGGAVEIWKNPDSTQTYAANTFTLSTDKTYKSFIAIYHYQTTSNRSLSANALIGDRASMFNFELLSNGSIRQVFRDITLAQSGSDLTITIGDCYHYLKNGWTAPTSTYDNSYMIPVAIYGLE